jgi:hypothetical protein
MIDHAVDPQSNVGYEGSAGTCTDPFVKTLGNNLINIIGGQSLDLTNPYSNLHYVKKEYGSKDKLVEKAKGVAVTSQGLAIAALGSAAIVVEQKPINENWRVREALKTLIETSSPVTAANKVMELTMKIEMGAAALVAMVVFSNNPVVAGPREVVYRWSEMGQKREEFRKSMKDEELRINNDLRADQYKRPRGLRGKEKRLKIEEIKQKKLEEVVNPARLKAGKRLKKTKLQKNQAKLERKVEKSNILNTQRLASGKQPKKLKAQKKIEKTERRIQKEGAKNNRRRLKGKKEKESLLPIISRRTAKELNDLGIALGLGAGIVVFNNGMRNRQYTIKGGFIDALKASIEISLVSGFIGYTVATGTEKAKIGLPIVDHTVHFEQQAQWVVDYGLNTKFIIGALLALQSPSLVKKLYHRLPHKEREFRKWLESEIHNA